MVKPFGLRKNISALILLNDIDLWIVKPKVLKALLNIMLISWENESSISKAHIIAA